MAVVSIAIICAYTLPIPLDECIIPPLDTPTSPTITPSDNLLPPTNVTDAYIQTESGRWVENPNLDPDITYSVSRLKKAADAAALAEEENAIYGHYSTLLEGKKKNRY